MLYPKIYLDNIRRLILVIFFFQTCSIIPAYSSPYIAHKTLGDTSAYLSSPDSVNHDNEWINNPEENFENSNPLHVTHVLYSYPEYKRAEWGSSSTGLPGLNAVFHAPEDIDKENLTPIILIHGWQGDNGLTDPANLITYDTSAESYFYDFINYFSNTPELYRKYRLFLYKYPSYKHITFNARILDELIREISYFDTRKPIILEHSMGVLVSIAFIDQPDAIIRNI